MNGSTAGSLQASTSMCTGPAGAARTWGCWAGAAEVLGGCCGHCSGTAGAAGWPICSSAWSMLGSCTACASCKI